MDKQQAFKTWHHSRSHAAPMPDEETCYYAGWEDREAEYLIRLAHPDHTIEPNWKQEMAELRSRPDDDPYKVAISKIYDLMQGTADNDLKGVWCMAFLKQAIEPLVKAVAGQSDAGAHAITFAKWLRDNTIADGAPKLLCIEKHRKSRKTIPELYQIFNPSGAAPQVVKLPDSFYNCIPYGYEFVNEEPLIQSNYDGEGNEIPGLCCCVLMMKTKSAQPTSSRSQENAPPPAGPVTGFTILYEALDNIAHSTAFPIGEEQCYSWIQTAQEMADKALKAYNSESRPPAPAGPVLTKELFNELINAGRDMATRDRLGNVYLAADDYYKQICERVAQ